MRGTVKHYIHGGLISCAERTVNLALGFSAISEQSRLVGPRLKPIKKCPDFPERLYSGSNPRHGLQFQWPGSGLWGPEAASQEFGF